jgi:tetratricopeptide (TPR) repeat protein
MPRVATDIPHMAFTHHRIAVHSEAAQSQSDVPLGTLVPFEDVSHLPEIDRDRNLGLAYLDFAYKQAVPVIRHEYRARAESLLDGVRHRGLSDPEVAAALARLYWEDDPARSLDLAREALRSANLAARSRVNALLYAGHAALRTNQIELAVKTFEELVGLRRHSDDWLLLGKCRQHLGDLKLARHDLECAAAIAPFRPEIYQALADVCEGLGDAKEAARQRALAGRLSAAGPPGR